MVISELSYVALTSFSGISFLCVSTGSPIQLYTSLCHTSRGRGQTRRHRWGQGGVLLCIGRWKNGLRPLETVWCSRMTVPQRCWDGRRWLLIDGRSEGCDGQRCGRDGRRRQGGCPSIRTKNMNFPTNWKGYDKPKTTYRKLSAERIQICWVYFCVVHFWPLFKITFQIMSEQKYTK